MYVGHMKLIAGQFGIHLAMDISALKYAMHQNVLLANNACVGMFLECMHNTHTFGL